MPFEPILSSQPPGPASPAPPTAPASSGRRTDGQRGELMAHCSKSGARISVHRCGLSDWPRRGQKGHNFPNARATHTRRGSQISVRIVSQSRASSLGGLLPATLVLIGLRWAVSYPPHFKRQVAGGVSVCPPPSSFRNSRGSARCSPRSTEVIDTGSCLSRTNAQVGGATPEAGR